MENRAILVVLGMAAWASLGCSSSDAGGSDGGATSRTADGGMDGGGQIGVGLAWNKDVFLQPLWQDGALTMNVVNRRPRAVELTLTPFVCAPNDSGWADSCEVVPMPAVATWQVPAASTASFDGSPPLAQDGLLRVKVDDENLGLMEAPRAPLGAEPGAFISNQGFGTGSGNFSVELTTSYASVPGDTFQARLTLTHGGRLFVAPSASPEPSVVLLTPRAARADAQAIAVSGDEFFVDVPESASETSPFELELEFALPSSAPTGSLFVISSGHLCTSPEGSARSLESCGSQSVISRLLLPSP